MAQLHSMGQKPVRWLLPTNKSRHSARDPARMTRVSDRLFESAKSDGQRWPGWRTIGRFGWQQINDGPGTFYEEKTVGDRVNTTRHHATVFAWSKVLIGWDSHWTEILGRSVHIVFMSLIKVVRRSLMDHCQHIWMRDLGRMFESNVLPLIFIFFFASNSLLL